MASQIGLPEVDSDNHNQVNWKQIFEESRKDNARLQEQVAHLSTQIEVLTKIIQAMSNNYPTERNQQKPAQKTGTSNINLKAMGDQETKQQTTKPDPKTGSKYPIDRRKRGSH
ncbi:hypothetical protein GWI33_009397 [Rhynchophorus ferrugineus]|uniref:Uncharacterized protein n=1 Tax=Rhynchophorus ferrugineus TaxID=354439 RepID=A0A834INB5_RHYFE|nr:hypothetical protein GWI33_009397 [Rhynchophorus ferrugineus]